MGLWYWGFFIQEVRVSSPTCAFSSAGMTVGTEATNQTSAAVVVKVRISVGRQTEGSSRALGRFYPSDHYDTSATVPAHGTTVLTHEFPFSEGGLRPTHATVELLSRE